MTVWVLWVNLIQCQACMGLKNRPIAAAVQNWLIIFNGIARVKIFWQPFQVDEEELRKTVGCKTLSFLADEKERWLVKDCSRKKSK